MKTIKILLFSVLLTMSLHAQTITGSIKGVVLDASGAAVPKVKVSVTKSGTNLISNTVSNESGNYTFPFLTIGQYTVTAEATGFKKSRLGPFTLETNQVATVDIKLDQLHLAVGALAQDAVQTSRLRRIRPHFAAEMLGVQPFFH